MAADELFRRDEVLGGLPARRAAATLFLVESRAAYLADQSRQSANFLVSENAARRRELGFVEAFNGGREPPIKATILDLEHFAPDWAPMVPANPSIRATVAHMLGRKYRFTRDAVPRLRAALGLDAAAVAQAYRRQYGDDLGTIYTVRVRTAERLSMAWTAFSSRVDALPPFWLTFFLTIAFSFSQAFLALPTGVAGMGPLPGVAFVVAVGAVNILTVACMAEACARSGDFHYGKAFFGRLVTGYLGGEASAIVSVITALRTFLVMLAGSIGISLTLAASTGIRADLWMVLVAAAELYYLSRESKNVTVTTMFALLGVNLALYVTITTVALGSIAPLNLLRVQLPFLHGAPFEPALLRLVFGVIVMLYIGHVYVIQAAKIVMPRDPSGRSLIKGSIAGTAALVAIFTAWIFVVNGVVPAERLIREAGTPLPALAEHVGPAIHLLGSLLVVMLLGMSCLRSSTVMFNLVQERLPTRLGVTLTVPRRRGDLLFETHGENATRLGVRYLGLTEGIAQLRVDAQGTQDVVRTDVAVSGSWDAGELLTRVRGARVARAAGLAIDVLDAQPDAVRVRVTTTMRLSASGEWTPTGRHLLDATELTGDVREAATWLMRRGEATLAEAVLDRGGDRAATQALLDALVDEGFAERVGARDDARYRIRLGPRRAREMPADLWAALHDAAPAPVDRRHDATPPSAVLLSAWRLALGDTGQFVLAASPVVVVLLLAEFMLLRGSASFAAVLGFGGVVGNSMTAGIFPVLLLVASRRKGERIPATVYRVLGHPAFVLAVYAAAMLNLFVHGLVIYHQPWMRTCALVFGVGALVGTARMLRAGALSRRAVLELRADGREADRAMLTVITAGRPVAADVTLARPDGDETLHGSSVAVRALSKITRVTVRFPRGPARDVKVWAHRAVVGGTTEALAAVVEVGTGDTARRFDVNLSAGQALAPLDGPECVVRISFGGGEDV
jgi:hypothetical protein